MAALLGLLLVGLPLASAPVGAAPLPMDLDLVSGQLSIRDGEEPAALEVPTTLDATVDDATGLITEGNFAAAPLSFQFDITEPVVATVFVDAVFTQITPGAVTGSVTKLPGDKAAVSVGVDVRVDLDIDVGDPSFLHADCTATPVSLRLTSTVPYDYETDQVSLEDADFSVPPVPTTDTCEGIIADGVNERLAGGGHSIDMNMTGEIPLIRIGVHPTTTALTVEPESSRQGDEVTLSAQVTPDPENAPPGAVAGVVEFRDGSTVLGSVPVDGTGEATLATTLAVGHRALTAAYQGDEVYAPSTSAAVAHLVAAAPTVTLPDPIQPIIIGQNARPVTVALANPADTGATIDGARLDITVARVGSTTAAFTPGRLTLEYFDGSTWTPLTLTMVTPRVLRGSVPGVTLAPGDELDARFRLKAFAVGTTVSTTACGNSNPTCPGPLTVTAALVSGDDVRTFATDEGPVNLVEVTRRPTTAAFGGGAPRPHTIRQGYSLSPTTLLSPSFGSVPWGGVIEAYVDGVQVPIRDVSTPFETGYTDQLAVRASSAPGWILLPADIEPGISHQITVRYLGDPFHGPAEVSGSFTVLAAAGHHFVCRESNGGANIEWGANVVFDADLPATALAGTEVDFSVDDARLLMHRQTVAGPLLFVDDGTTIPLGVNNLEAITFDLAGQGSASGLDVTRTGGTSLLPAPNPAPESDVDQTYDVGGVTGTVTVSGAPGDVVPVELSELVFSYRDPLFNFPLEARCTARDEPMDLGEIETAGTKLTATPNPAREITDEVDLEATTFPSDAAGSVSFSSSEDGALGNVMVAGGSATLSIDELSDGEHLITATFNATDPEVPDSQVTETIKIQYSPRSDAEAFVVAARTDYLGSAERADVVADAEALDEGLSKSAYLRQLSRSDGYLARVVEGLYQDTLGRSGDEAGVAFWIGRLRGGWSVARVTASFYGSAEYFARAGGTAETWIDDLYGKLLGRSSDTGGRAFWVGEVDRAGRGAVALRFFQSRESARARVVALYELFLDRVPPLADQDFWANRVITQGDLALAVSLTASAEYAERAEIRFPLV